MAPNTVQLNIRTHFEKDFPLNSASTPIKPGMLVEINANRKVIPFDAVALPKPFLVAVEMPIRSGSGIEDAYNVASEAVPCYYALPGDELYMMLEAGNNVAKGALLENSGNGYLQAATSFACVQALEAVNNSAGYDGARIRVEVL